MEDCRCARGRPVDEVQSRDAAARSRLTSSAPSFPGFPCEIILAPAEKTPYACRRQCSSCVSVAHLQTRRVRMPFSDNTVHGFQMSSATRPLDHMLSFPVADAATGSARSCRLLRNYAAACVNSLSCPRIYQPSGRCAGISIRGLFLDDINVVLEAGHAQRRVAQAGASA